MQLPIHALVELLRKTDALKTRQAQLKDWLKLAEQGSAGVMHALDLFLANVLGCLVCVIQSRAPSGSRLYARLQAAGWDATQLQRMALHLQLTADAFTAFLHAWHRPHDL